MMALAMITLLHSGGAVTAQSNKAIVGTPVAPINNADAATANQQPPDITNVDYVVKMVDSPIDDIQWATDDFVVVLTDNGQVYTSVDGGRTWKNLMSKFTTSSGAVVKVASFHISDANAQYIFFMGTNQANWLTTNLCETIVEGGLADLQEIRLHPTQASWLLGSTKSRGCNTKAVVPKGDKKECYKQLHWSKDFGVTWNLATTYVVQFDWSLPFGNVENGRRPSDEVVYATVHNKKEGNQRFGYWDKNIDFVQSTDFFGDYEVMVEHGNRFLFGDNSFLFVAAVDTEEKGQVKLMISRDNDTDLEFDTAIIPMELPEHSYTILDTSEGSVFLHVNFQPFADKAYAGHVLSSDWTGLVYTESLQYNHRASDGKCDFEKVEGLEGIYLANVVEVLREDEEEAAQTKTSGSSRKAKTAVSAAPKKKLHTQTKITFDKGGKWSYLTPPKVDSLGKKIYCQDPKNCHLHLHGITDSYGPFYTTASATGLILATGAVSKYLQSNTGAINTYLSRDAGLTWSEVMKGSHIYEFGDHGALIVMAEDDKPVTEVQFSWDQGITWRSIKVADKPFLVENIIIEPSATGEQFIVYGSQDEAGIIVFLDFAELHQRECVGVDIPGQAGSDYEIWTPSDARLGGECLMGHTIQYTRRRQDSQCYNPELFDRKVHINHCQCTEDDFECDYGYERQGGSDDGECVLSAVKPLHHDPSLDRDCNDGQKYLRTTKGYRRIAGDTCMNGAQWDGTEVACPSPLFSKGAGVLVFIAILGLAIGVIVNCTNRTHCMGKFMNFIGAAKYSIITGRETDAPHSAADETDDPEFSLESGHSAQLLSEEGAINRRPTSDFAPLPPINRSNGSARTVPVLAPAHADEFDPRRQQV